MTRLGWAITATILLLSSLTAYRIYPSQKWWMRAGYVKGWQAVQWLGLDPCPSCPIPDRFK